MCEAEKYQVGNGFLVRNYYRGGLRFGFTTCLANYRNLNFSSKFWIICFHQYQKKKISFGLLADFAVTRNSAKSGSFNSWERGCHKYILGPGRVCGGGWE